MKPGPAFYFLFLAWDLSIPIEDTLTAFVHGPFTGFSGMSMTLMLV